MTAGLPPVGELVQITDTTGAKIVGVLRNSLFYAANGEGCWSPQCIASWCRVMVAPDTETTQRALRMKLWTEMEALGVDQSDARALSTALSHVALVALREAAIR
jgi:hypothetical protein